MNLPEKEHILTQQIMGLRMKHSRPIILCSFGKDSMVMAHMIRRTWSNVPIIHWRETSQFQKYDFADEIIREWNLTVFDYPPVANDVIYHDGHFDGLGFRRVGDGLFYVAIELLKPTGELFSCAIRDILGRPVAQYFSYPWDLTFLGLKASDNDPILGAIKLNTDSFQLGTTTIIMPLREWTDEDIWEYTKKYDLPHDRKRYNPDSGFKDFNDKTYNNNYHYACTNCLNPEFPEKVYCPLQGIRIENVGPKINYAKKLEEYKKMFSYIDWEKENA